MRLTDRDNDSTTSLTASPDYPPEAGPSTANGHATNGHAHGTNGASGAASTSRPNGKAVTQVALSGTTLYDDSFVDREEFVRLVIQSLRDVGYIESAATLEAESGYIMEAPEVSEFRQCILDASWEQAEASLVSLGVSDEQALVEARWLIHQQRYLELLDEQNTSSALAVLRNDLAPLNVDPEQLQALSSLLMCSDVEDLRARSGWDGAIDTSRRRLLSQLQRYIPSSVMIPQRRISTLLNQALAYQRNNCVYHNVAVPSPSHAHSSTLRRKEFSLYIDHVCEMDVFPRVTTMILDGHKDEVWNLQWSHSGVYLASSGKDKRALVWKIGPETDSSIRECSLAHDLSDHEYSVSVCEWSLDDSILLSAADHLIKVWSMRTGMLIRTLDAHTDTVTALSWLPDNSGFISASMDRKIIIWDADGKQRDNWGATPIRVTDLVVTPDQTRVIALGMYIHPITAASTPGGAGDHGVSGTPPTANAGGAILKENKMIVYDFMTKQIEATIRFEGELTSVKVSADSQYVVVDHAPDEVVLWDLSTNRVARKFTGQKQKRHVIRSCFGGVEQSFVASGSEDGNVHIWHRETGALLETLPGHGAGSVNAVAWNPRNGGMFASCSDDNTIRIWEALPAGPLVEEPDLMVPEEDMHGKGKGKSRWDSVAPSASTSSLSSFGTSL